MSQTDMVRQDSAEETFGKDLTLVGEAVVTGRKVGANRQFWVALAHDKELFARVVAMVLATLRLVVNFTQESGEKILALWVGENHEGWSYLGPVTTGTKELDIEVINFPGETLDNLAAVRKRCDALGYELVSGQAIAAYERKYPKAIGDKKLIFFGGSEFRGPGGGSRVACLGWRDARWGRYFYWSDFDFHDACWFAVVRKSGMEVATQ